MRPVDSWQYRVNGGSWIPYSGGEPAWASGDVTLTGLTNGVEYTIDIRAVNTVGPGPYNSATATPYTIPSAVTLNSVTNGPACDQIIVNYTLGSDGGNAITQTFVTVYLDGDFYSNFAMEPAGVSPATVTIPGIGGNVIVVYAYATNAAGDSPEGNFINVQVNNANNCNIRVAGSTYSFINGTFNRRHSGYVVRREDVQPYDGFYYGGALTTAAYSPSGANDQTDGGNIIMGPNQALTDISEGYTIYTNPNRWSYLVYSYDSDAGSWDFTEAFYNESTGSTIPLGTWTAGGGWGSNITVS
jgi:hypothetical protein